MPNDLTAVAAITADATKAIEALPIITSAISKIQTDLTNSQHASVVTAAADALTVAAQSAKALGAAGLIGHNDASNVETGAADAAEGLTIWGEVEALAAKLRALVAHIV